MRTIDSILKYHFTPSEIKSMTQRGIMNGCGGNGHNLDKILRPSIELLEGYDEAKSEVLFQDITAICNEHDYEFSMKMGFYASNFRMAVKVFRLLHWGGYKRFFVALGLFLVLCKLGKQFYY